MKPFDWNRQKSILLRSSRGIGFEEVVNAINDGYMLAIIEHPNSRKYTNQKIYIINFDDYAYCIPFVANKEIYFLKTIYPSRKYTKKFLEGKE
ncbi:MAG TPA: toxin [Candidatus Dormibacteraeota bacterium]|nr:toxin [Candidatus Dormibacteraeota bacterium]